MKRIIWVVMVIISISLLSGCTKNYNSITYTKFIETFKDKEGFLVDNQSLKYENKFERCIEASGNNIQFLYYEFKTEEAAKTYLSDNYKGRRKYRYRENKNYTTVKCTDKMYFYAVQMGKVVVIGDSPIKKNKRVINKIFKELEY